MFISRVGLCLLLAIATVAFAAGKQIKPRMGISPPKIELELDEKGASDSITVLNVSDNDLDVQVTVSNWALDENNEVKILPPEEHSLDRWIIINPLRFTIPKGESQTVRFAIRPLARPQEGEHKAMIYFTEILPQDQVDQQGFRVAFKFGVPIYAYVGEKIIAGRLLDSTVELQDTGNIKAKFRIVNDGNVNIRLSGRYAIWRSSEYPGEPLASAWIENNEAVKPNDVERQKVNGKDIAEPVVTGPVKLPPVFPGNDRWIEMLFQQPGPGVYKLLVAGDLAGKPIVRTLEFTRR